MTSEKMLEAAIQDGIREGIKSKFSGYNTPLDKLVQDAIAANAAKFKALLEDSVATFVANEAFRDEIRSAVHRALAKNLIQKFGGEIEKRVNVLKSDPTTRAKITLAISEIVKAQG